MKYVAQDIEILVARHFGVRTTLIVPNVSWGWGLRYEADMVVLRSGYAMEIEIKVSASDIVADTKKQHCHDSPRFRMLWFAVPETLAHHPKIPEKAGILAICRTEYQKGTPWAYGVDEVKVVRPPKINKLAPRITMEQRLKLAELGTMRIWDLKSALASRINRAQLKINAASPEPSAAPITQPMAPA